MAISFFLMVPQVLLAVLVVLKPPALASFSTSTSGGPDLRHVQATFNTLSSFSVKTGFSGDLAAEDLTSEAGEPPLDGTAAMAFVAAEGQERRNRRRFADGKGVNAR